MSREIGDIGSAYGGLDVKEEDGKFFWSIENYDGHDWDEIPEYLYLAFNKFQDEAESAKQTNKEGQ